jgi:hypothetical protein
VKVHLDDNHGEIVKTLEAVGASVQSLAALGRGAPDLLVGFQGRNFLLEVKDGRKAASKRKLRPSQVLFHARWIGQIATVTSPAEALAVILGRAAIIRTSPAITP